MGREVLMIRAVGCVLLLVLNAGLAAAEHLATLTKNHVSVELSLERGEGAAATLVGVFTPDAPKLHLYAPGLPADGAGVPTRLDPKPGGPLVASGPLAADGKTHEHE